MTLLFAALFVLNFFMGQPKAKPPKLHDGNKIYFYNHLHHYHLMIPQQTFMGRFELSLREGVQVSGQWI
jgi:hypothetical protein